MKLGNNFIICIMIIFVYKFISRKQNHYIALLNLEKIKPSFEEEDEKNVNFDNINDVKIKKKKIKFLTQLMQS